MLKNPKLFEINTRVWIKRFGDGVKLSQIPDDHFKKLADKGIDVIWLMGIWKTSPEVIEKSRFSVALISAYNKALPDWKKEDVIGSPFSIDVYKVNPILGTSDDLEVLRNQVNKSGMKLVLDFVPNHFSSASKLIRSNPELFLKADTETLESDPATFFKPDETKPDIFAHGRDPFFPAWTDTVQLNYFNQQTQEFMIQTLLNISEKCDGVRCDMAMLALNNVFKNTWLGVLNKSEYKSPEKEFWDIAIKRVKEKSKDFIFLAEAYWDLEWDLQQAGFDFTYDKKLTDRLISNEISEVKLHLNADIAYQEKSARFLENHDEQRAIVSLGTQRSLAAAVLISTIPGMKLYFDGQFEGKKIRLPVQLGREPIEKPTQLVVDFYNKLLPIINSRIFTEGEFYKLEIDPAAEGNNSYEDMFAFLWKLESEMWIVVINYSDSASQCRIIFDPETDKAKITLTDHLTGDKYIRKVEEIKNAGLYIELKCYRGHIFSIEK
jgi:hypothetical protein